MSDDGKPVGAPFLSRWSRLKRDAVEHPVKTQPAAEAMAPMPELPPVDTLSMESDFSGFLHPQVDPNLRCAALKKLFSDPHFNLMDGLDTYIDDYSKPNPLPASMLAGLRQAQHILAWAKETPAETAARFAPKPIDGIAIAQVEKSTIPVDEIAPLSAVEVVADATPESIELSAAEQKS